MSQRRPTFAIVGANLTGGAAASTLRDRGFDGRVVLIGEEPHPPYERPPLSKEYLREGGAVEDLLLRPQHWYKENDVELVLGRRATRVDVRGRAVELEGGERVRCDRVLIATGGRNRPLPVPGRDLEGVHDLRTIEDADRIRAEAARASRAVVVGAGFIGCEVTASLRQMGVEVEVVEVFDRPLLRAVGPEVGAVYEAIHRDRGVRFHFGQSVRGFEGRGRVEAAVTDRDARIPCDLAVVGIGIEPATEVVRGTGVEVGNGVVVDERCRTAVDWIYAAGDVANHHHPVFGARMRVEHWDNALKQGAAAALNMMGVDTVFDDLHWFWSDQYEHNLQYLGFAPEYDELVVRGSVGERRFVGFYLKDGIVRAVVGVDGGRDVRRAGPLIAARRPVDPDLLRDEDVDLRKLAAAAPADGEEGRR